MELRRWKYQVTDQLYHKKSFDLVVEKGIGTIQLKIDPLASFILNLNEID